MKNGRKSNIELLRILAIFFIMLSHFSSHGGFDTETLTMNSLFLNNIQILGKIGVSLFTMISGYFLINSNKINVKKIIQLWLQVLVYSISFYFIVGIFFNDYSIEMSSFLKQFMPISTRVYWYISAYFILYILHPYINKLLINLNQNQYRQLIIILTIIWCIIPTLFNKKLECNDFLWLVYLYIVSGYIKIYYKIDKRNTNKHLINVILSFIMCFTIILFFNFINKDYKIMFGLQKLPTLIVSVSIFLLFLDFNIKSKLINTIGKCTFGIYLIHDNSIFKNHLWQDLLKTNSHYSLNFILFFMYTILSIIIVFLICLFIEYARKKIENIFFDRRLFSGNGFTNKEIEI